MDNRCIKNLPAVAQAGKMVDVPPQHRESFIYVGVAVSEAIEMGV